MNNSTLISDFDKNLFLYSPEKRAIIFYVTEPLIF